MACVAISHRPKTVDKPRCPVMVLTKGKRADWLMAAGGPFAKIRTAIPSARHTHVQQLLSRGERVDNRNGC